MTVEPLSSHRLYEQLAERIRHLILKGSLNPGDRLPTERNLARDYGVSRTVVREAVKALQQDGLIEVKAGLGTFVVDATGQAVVQSLHLLMSLNLNDNMADVVEIREILEVEMANLAAARATPMDIDQMQSAVAIMDENLDNVCEFIRQDHAFHLALARATQNAVMPLLISSIVDLLQRSRSRTALVDGSLERGQAHHKQILQAIRQGDAAGAQTAMQLHLEQVRRDSEAALAQQTGQRRPSSNPL